MSRYLTRLAKLEAARPVVAPVAFQPTSSLADVIAKLKRFATLTPKQKVAELRERLRKDRERSQSPVPGLNAKLDNIHLCFRDVTERQLHEAEVDLLAELGHPNASHPLTPEQREIIDIEMFDA